MKPARPSRDPVFVDPLSRALEAEIARVAPSNANILIHGETGTGKELVARHIHRLSHRRDLPFVAVNCAALSESLFESELFGHEKGAFTGAVSSTAGWFEAADGGTLFLDEIGELAPAMQAKLLRVLQEREVTRVGARMSRPVDVRLVTATNVNLERAIVKGQFREDLFYRIRVATLFVPPLRQRRGDILPIARRFCVEYGAGRPITLTADAEAALLGHEWPGNIREMENVVHSALIGFEGVMLRAADLGLRVASDEVDAAPQRCEALERVIGELLATGEHDLLELVLRTAITEAYEFSHRNQVHAAAALGISRNVLRTYLQRYGILNLRRVR